MKRREFIAWHKHSSSRRWAYSGELADWPSTPFERVWRRAATSKAAILTVIYRSAGGQFDRLPALAAELVKSQGSIIFATGSPVPARAAKAATSTITIVFAYGL